MADKIANLAYLPTRGQDQPVRPDVDGEALLVWQFTLMPIVAGGGGGFTYAALPDVAARWWIIFGQRSGGGHPPGGNGRVRGSDVGKIHNDGPFTIILDSEDLGRS